MKDLEVKMSDDFVLYVSVIVLVVNLQYCLKNVISGIQLYNV